MTDALLLSSRDLERVLDFSAVVACLEAAFRAEHAGAWNTPRRISAHTRAGGLLAMPCAGGTPEAMGAKLVTTFAGNSANGRPSVAGLYALFDPHTGELLSVMDGGYLTLVRTAAVSALATRVLSRPDAATLGVLGAGRQAEFHIRLLATVRPIREVVIWARDASRAQNLRASLRTLGSLAQITSFVVAEDPQEAAQADVVVTATSATAPVLLGRWLREGAHVNAIGAHTRLTREIDTETVTRASRLVVESLDTLLEAGDFQLAEEDSCGVIARVATLGSVIAAHDHDGGDSASGERGRTVFKSCGVAFEDLAVAALAFGRARDLGLGSRFSLL